MIFGDYNFAISYDVISKHEHCVLGLFNIIIDGNLMIHENSNWSIGSNISYLKDVVIKLDNVKLSSYKKTKEELFVSAARSFKSSVYSDPYYPDSWLKEKSKVYKDIIDSLDRFYEYWANNPIDCINIITPEIEDYGLQIYLFGHENKERLIYSSNSGKEVYEKILHKGTVRNVLSSLPDPKTI